MRHWDDHNMAIRPADSAIPLKVEKYGLLVEFEIPGSLAYNKMFISGWTFGFQPATPKPRQRWMRPFSIGC